MVKRIVLIHAVTPAMQPIEEAFARLWPEADRVNILDDSLPRDRGAAAALGPNILERFAALGDYTRQVKADGVLFTCSAFGEAIEAVARASAVPVLKPNEAMFEAALDQGQRIGMLATFQPSVASMEQEFHALAAARGAKANIRTICVPEAMTALNSGDVATHNALLAEAAPRLAGCDAILLAQFSTSRAEPAVAARVSVPVLTSPSSAVRKLKAALLGA
jgi:aspartate/glutamate racemase